MISSTPLLLLIILVSSAYSSPTQKKLDCSYLNKEQIKNKSELKDARDEKATKFDEFDWQLSKELNTGTGENLVISPVSLKIVLAMLLEGATGQTAQEIQQALNLSNDTQKTREHFSHVLKSLEKQDGKNKIKIGNHVFVEKNTRVKDPFQCALMHFYNSDIEKVDFSNTTAAVHTINTWASNVTEGHIQHLVSEAEDHSSTIMLLLNAVYFKGLWKIPFPTNQTRLGKFHLNGKESKDDVPLMNTTDTYHYTYLPDLQTQIIRLPYLGEKYAMYVMLPDKVDGLNNLVQNLGPKIQLTNRLKQMRPTSVNLIMPKFEFHFTTSLRRVLEKLNMKTMFTPLAELSNIADTNRGNGLVVSNVLQKAGISVNEIGTEAYAATVIELMDKFGGSEEVVEFKADHPFLFFIRDESINTVLFVGKLTHPEQAQSVENKMGTSKPTPTTKPVVASVHSSTTQKELNCLHLEREHIKNKPELKDEKATKFDPFDWQLSKELNAASGENLVISPISLKIVLAMLLEGATGQTAQEIQLALNLSNDTQKTRDHFSHILKSLGKRDGMNKIKIGNHVFVEKNTEVKDPFQCALMHFYNSSIEKVDFSNTTAAVNTINTWASNVTEGHIHHLVSEAEDHSSTIMLLLNAVYFKGLWKIPFPTNQTYLGKFHLNDEEIKENVPLMNTTDTYYYTYLRDLEAQIIRLPYLGDKYAMYIMLPDKTDGLNALAQKLGPKIQLTNRLKEMTPTSVNLFMPKFEFHFTTSLRPILNKLNIKTMFTPFAELSNIADTKNGNGLVMSNVLQKAGISVNEVGTKAYAATTIELMNKFGGSDDVVEFKADHPFLFFIRDESLNTALFVGKVTHPEQAQSIEDRIGGSEPAPTTTPGVSPTHTPYFGQTFQESFDVDEAAIQSKSNLFDAAIFQELSEKEKGNFVVSTASIKTLLGLILEGAEGSTQTKLLEVLHLPQNITYARKALSALQHSLEKSTSQKVRVDVVTQMFLANTLKENATYAKTLKDIYKADVSPQDFSSPEVASNNINSWVRTRTGGLITDFINPDMITSNTYSLLTSAIYFDGKWRQEFRETKEDCFFSAPSFQCQMVPTMSKKEELFYKFDQMIDSHVVQIPYLDERFFMVVVMPSKKDGMRRLSGDASRIKFPDILNKMNPYEVKLTMPRFIMDYGTGLVDTLKKLHLTEIFSEDANLPYIVNGRLSRISAIVHKAKIEVTEKGTKAAAASGAAVVPLMFGQSPLDLNLNHPFYFFIYDGQSKTVLFSGRLSSVGDITSAVASSGYQPFAVPLGSTASKNQPIHFSDSSDFTYQAPVPSASPQPSYADVTAGNNYQAAIPTSQSYNNGVETYNTGAKPINHGTVNHRYNPYLPTRGYTQEISHPRY